MSGDQLRLFFITNKPDLAAYVVDKGVDRLFVDLELNGKVERQGHLSTVISRHSFDDIAAVRRAAPKAELMVRLNPPFDGSQREIDRAISLGADILMLPMFHSAAEAQTFSDMVGGRVQICLLVETPGAQRELAAIVGTTGVSEIHIGLNDLHLALKKTFMFELIADGLVDEMAGIVRGAGLLLGIGGVARVGEGLLPAELILAEHVRLGSTAAILSRTFHRNSESVTDMENEMDFSEEVRKLREAFAGFARLSPPELAEKHRLVQRVVRNIVAQRKASGPVAR